MKYLFVIILSSFVLSGCTKYLTHDDPHGVTDKEWWKTEKNARDFQSHIYAGVPDGTKGRQMMYLSGMSDISVARGSFKGHYDEYTLGLQNSQWDVALHFWRDDYIDIRRANRFLENVDRCFMDPALKLRFKYEARALRAYYNMELMMFFGDIPLITKTLTPEENKQPRDSLSKVYEFIKSEFETCAKNLPVEYDNENIWRINSGACWGLLARVALFMQDYETAKNAAKKVIDSKEYSLYYSKGGRNSYKELFSYVGELNDERIFFAREGCSNAWHTFAPMGIGGQTYISPTAKMVDMYETEQGKTLQSMSTDSMNYYELNPGFNRDPRMQASIYYPGENFMNTYTLKPFQGVSDKIGLSKSTATGYWVGKYLDEKDLQRKGGTLDYMILRYAEVLLDYVEAVEELGDWKNSDIEKYLNKIRERAGMPDLDMSQYNTQEKVRQLIRRERTVELAFEGQRYFDIRRWGIADDVMNGAVYGATNPQTEDKVLVENRTYDPTRDKWWPIPEQEINVNDNIKQNPGYGN